MTTTLTLDDIEAADVDDSTTEINGVTVSVSTDSWSHSDMLSQTITVGNGVITFKRDGYKIIEYDSWVDNCWFAWENY